MSTAERPSRRGAVELAAPPFWGPFDPPSTDGDGEPMADDRTQYQWTVTIAEGPDDLDLLGHFDPTDPRRCVAPDVFVASGRPRAPGHSHKEWLVGHAPRVVSEIHVAPDRHGARPTLTPGPGARP